MSNNNTTTDNDEQANEYNIREVAAELAEELPGDPDDWQIMAGDNGPERIVIVRKDDAAKEFARDIYEAGVGL